MNTTTINSIENQIESLRNEAYTLIQQAFKTPEGYADLSLNRLVDCIISAAVLQVASLQEQARKEQK